MTHFSKRLFSAAQLFTLCMAFHVTIAGCGSSSSTTTASDYKAICNAGCDKLAACTTLTTAADCKADGCTDAAIAACSNSAQIAPALKACNAMTDCNAWLTCIAGVPDCTTATSMSN